MHEMFLPIPYSQCACLQVRRESSRAEHSVYRARPAALSQPLRPTRDETQLINCFFHYLRLFSFPLAIKLPCTFKPLYRNRKLLLLAIPGMPTSPTFVPGKISRHRHLSRQGRHGEEDEDHIRSGTTGSPFWIWLNLCNPDSKVQPWLECSAFTMLPCHGTHTSIEVTPMPHLW